MIRKKQMKTEKVKSDDKPKGKNNQTVEDEISDEGPLDFNHLM